MKNTERILNHIRQNIFNGTKTEVQREAIRVASDFFIRTFESNVEKFSKYTNDFDSGYIISKSLDYFSMYVNNYYILSFEKVSDKETSIQKNLQYILKDIQDNVVFSF